MVQLSHIDTPFLQTHINYFIKFTGDVQNGLKIVKTNNLSHPQITQIFTD